MKRFFILFLLSMLAATAIGCGSAAKTQATPVPTAQPTASLSAEGGDRSNLLAEFPVGIMPLYACTKVTSSRIQHNDHDKSYTLYASYLTSAAKEEILACYQGLMSNAKLTAGESVTGEIAQRSAYVYFNESNQDQKALQVDVSINVSGQGMPAENPYFADYPGTIAILGGDKNTLSGKTYEKMDNGEYRYTISCQSTLTESEFKSLYEKSYGKLKGFKLGDSYGTGVSYYYREGNLYWQVSLSTLKTTAGSTFTMLNIYSSYSLE